MAKLDLVLNRIVHFLRLDTRGLTIGELSKLTKSSRITTARALSKLEGSKKVIVRRIGNCSLHYLNVEVKG